MPHLHRRTALAGAVAAALLAASDPAVAAGQRSFVSAASGVDNPACSIGSPCRSFGAAITVTNAGGEVIALDSGGFGPVTITQSVSIIASPGVYAGISVFSGNGVTVTTGASDTVKLEGLTVNNQGASGDGVRFDGAGTLAVERVEVSGFQAGAAIRFVPVATSSLVGSDLRMRDSLVGLWVDGGPSSVGAKVTLDGVHAQRHGQIAVYLVNSINAVVRNAVLAHSLLAVNVDGFAGTAQNVTLEGCDISNNGVGVYPSNLPTVQAFVAITHSVIASNETGLSAGTNSVTRLAASTITGNAQGISGSGTVESQGNNFIFGNALNGPAPSIVGSK